MRKSITHHPSTMVSSSRTVDPVVIQRNLPPPKKQPSRLRLCNSTAYNFRMKTCCCLSSIHVNNRLSSPFCCLIGLVVAWLFSSHISGAWCWQVSLPLIIIPSLQQRQRRLPGLQSSPHPRLKTTTTSLQISNIFGGGGIGGKDNKPTVLPSLPRNVKEAVSKCRAATQEALQKRISRMNIEFPVGAKFNVEASSSKKKRGTGSDQASSAPSRAELDRSDRELARLFVEMFQPVGGDHITVVFGNVALADEAKEQWKGDVTMGQQCFITSVDRQRRTNKAANKKKAKSKGFAAKLAAEVGDGNDNDNENDTGPFKLPENTEVALFVAPGPKQLLQVEKICQAVGMGTLVILLNARLSSISNFGTVAAAKLFTKDFESIFHLGAAPQDAAPNCLLYRSYPGDWVLARKPSVGQPKTILSQREKPTAEQCRVALESLELSDVERGLENVLQNAAEWFK
jgi:Domain of unknown function (DUF1995)